MSKISTCLFEKIDQHIQENATNDFHCILIMLSCAQERRLMEMQKSQTLIESYFQANPEIYDIVKNYKPSRLLKFLERIVRNHKIFNIKLED